MDGYLTALEAAGANVLHYGTFGNWQGTWIAILPGNLAVEGAYGSCDGCDEFEKFFWNRDERAYGYKDLLAEFGRSLLARAVPIKQIITAYTNRIQKEKDRADPEDKEILAWLVNKQGISKGFRDSVHAIVGGSFSSKYEQVEWIVEVCESYEEAVGRANYMNDKLKQLGLHWTDPRDAIIGDMNEIYSMDEGYMHGDKGASYIVVSVPFRKKLGDT